MSSVRRDRHLDLLQSGRDAVGMEMQLRDNLVKVKEINALKLLLCSTNLNNDFGEESAGTFLFDITAEILVAET